MTDERGKDSSHPLELLRPWIPLCVGLVAAATSVLVIFSRVLGGSKLQYFDYWRIFDSTVTDSGDFEVSNLLVLQNEHPVALARVLYFINAKLWGGSNVSLGLIVMAIVAIQVVVLQRHNPMVGRLPRASFLLAVVALLFGTGGVHNFQFAMSGSAWLTANLAVIVACHLAVRGRPTGATLAGVVASASYGTGLMIWPPLMLLAIGERDGRARRMGMVGAGWAFSWIVYASIYVRPPSRGFPLNPAGIVNRAISTLGAAVASEIGVATIVGGVIIAIALLAIAQPGSLEVGMALALTIFGVLNAGLIAFSRGGFGELAGLSSRYVSLSALTILGVVGLAARVERNLALVMALVFGLLASVAGVPRLDHFDGHFRSSREATVAVVLSAGEGYYPVFDSAIRSKLVAINHYPFDGSFDLDCGLLGESLELAPEQDTNRSLLETESPDPELRRFVGFLTEAPPKCLVVTDASDIVVGVGVVGGPPDASLNPPPESEAFVVLVPADVEDAISIVGVSGVGATVPLAWTAP